MAVTYNFVPSAALLVTLIQRFGSALNLNVHLHKLILDGVYTLEQNGPQFHRVGEPDAPTPELA